MKDGREAKKKTKDQDQDRDLEDTSLLSDTLVPWPVRHGINICTATLNNLSHAADAGSGVLSLINTHVDVVAGGRLSALYVCVNVYVSILK